jgi:MarR family transcriptional regulator, temperature-dependent positive regulator of motility
MAGKSGRKTAAGRAGIHPMLAVKLWGNPCWLSFRVNFVAHHFNQPVYEWIEKTHGLSAAEHIVLYALALKDGITADDVVASTARPKNTLSRGVAGLLRRGLVSRKADRKDRRRLILRLTRDGRRVARDTVPALVAHERAMAQALTAAETKRLKTLLDKIILRQDNWPTRIQKRSA